jgi:hypothetical protein
MANFNLADYETVEERIKRFYTDHPDGRIITKNMTTLQDRQAATWVVKATIYFDEGSLAARLPKATGLAFEVDSARGPQATSALEVCETSAIGRALANAGYSGNKRASREEMEKVQRGITPVKARDWQRELTDLLFNKDADGIRKLYVAAVSGKADPAMIEKIKDAGIKITN